MTATLGSHQTGTPTPDDEAQTLRARIAEIGAKHSTFRADVREALLEQRRTESWCLPGTNAALEDLDLEQITLEFTGTVTVQVDVTVRNADDRETAEGWLKSAISIDSTDRDVDFADLQVDCACLSEEETS